jgi:BlaI family penicillinase repressor
MKFAPPSSLELQILSVLWKHGPLPARSVLEFLPDGKKRAYTSVLSVMQVMEKKGLLEHKTEGNRHVYAPLLKKGAVLKPLLKSWLTNIFGGSPANAMQHFLESSEVTAEEISQMREMLGQYERQKSGKDKGGSK